MSNYIRPILPMFQSSFHKLEDIENTRRHYEEMGIRVIDAWDELSWNVIFPEGWYEDYDSYWTNIYDENKKLRMSYFLKLCFWDYDTFVHFKEDK